MSIHNPANMKVLIPFQYAMPIHNPENVQERPLQRSLQAQALWPTQPDRGLKAYLNCLGFLENMHSYVENVFTMDYGVLMVFRKNQSMLKLVVPWVPHIQPEC